MYEHHAYLPEVLDNQSDPWQVDATIIEDTFPELMPQPLPGANELIVKFRHDHFRGVRKRRGPPNAPEPYIPHLLAMIRCGAQVLIALNIAEEAEASTVHRAISGAGFCPGEELREVSDEIESGILELRSRYRSQLALRREVEAVLQPGLESQPTAYRLTKLFAHTYTIESAQSRIHSAREGLLELLITPLEPDDDRSSQKPYQLLSRLENGEFDTLIAKDILVHTATATNMRTGAHIASLLAYSRQLASSLGADANEAKIINGTLDHIDLWPAEAIAEVKLAKAALQTLLAEACKQAAASVDRRGWQAFSNDPDQSFVQSRNTLLLRLSDWTGWPYDLLPGERVASMRRQRQPSRPPQKRSSPAPIVTPEGESGPRHALAFVDRDGHIHSIESDEFKRRIAIFLGIKNLDEAMNHITPVLKHIESIDFAGPDSNKLTTLKKVNAEVDGHPVYRLIVGQLSGVQFHSRSNLKAAHILMSVSTSPSGSNLVYIHSLATKATRQMAVEQLPQVINSHPQPPSTS